MNWKAYAVATMDHAAKVIMELRETNAQMLEALKLAKNVMFLLHDEVKALGHKAEQVPEKIRAAILKAEGEL